MPASQTVIARELTANAAWLRNLARSLVGESDADDLVQEAMIAALKQPPQLDRPVRPWLRTVVSNIARMQWRSSVSRVRREQQSPVADAPETPDRTVERLETQRQLVDAVMELAAPYREAVVLRYVDGLSAAEIARRLDVPAGTVRSRQKRGLELLRTELDRQSGGDRRRWQRALVPLLFPPPPSHAAPTLGSSGAVIMKLFAITTLAAVAAIAVASQSGSSATSQDGPTPGAEPAQALATSATISEPARVRPEPGATARRVPLQFPSSQAREQVAQAVGQARQGQAERPRMTFDFSEEALVGKPEPMEVTSTSSDVLDKHFIRARLSEVRPLIWECYELSGGLETVGAGVVRFQFVIDAEPEIGGFVREAELLEETTIKDEGFGECITETILSLAFVPPGQGREIVVQYGYSFGEAAN